VGRPNQVDFVFCWRRFWSARFSILPLLFRISERGEKDGRVPRLVVISLGVAHSISHRILRVTVWALSIECFQPLLAARATDPIVDS
jgi:hypothetical protein